MTIIKHLPNPQPHINQIHLIREGKYYVASWNTKRDEIEVFTSNVAGEITDYTGLSIAWPSHPWADDKNIRPLFN